MPDLAKHATAVGLDAAAVYVVVDLSKPVDAPGIRRLLDMIGHLDATRTVQVVMTASQGVISGYDAARRFLDAGLERAAVNNIDLLLYPHIRAWLEKVDDAIRLCSDYDHEHLGSTSQLSLVCHRR